jgi:hypothetical protein
LAPARSNLSTSAATGRYTGTPSAASRPSSTARRFPTYPEPVAHSAICTLAAECRERLIADDHLSLVAGARRDQRKRLTEGGIATVHALAATPAPD